MSSAKHGNLQKGKIIRILLINIENKLDDKCPSWGTPDFNKKVFDMAPNNFIRCCLFVKKR